MLVLMLPHSMLVRPETFAKLLNSEEDRKRRTERLNLRMITCYNNISNTKDIEKN